jgi:hypothetical protein
MRKIEQHKLLDRLRDFSSKMSKEDQYEFQMMQKRDKDDEELDDIAFRLLEQMYDRYVGTTAKKNMDELFKSFSQKQKGKDAV